jgi:hypothetical protein
MLTVYAINKLQLKKLIRTTRRKISKRTVYQEYVKGTSKYGQQHVTLLHLQLDISANAPEIRL